MYIFCRFGEVSAIRKPKMINDVFNNRFTDILYRFCDLLLETNEKSHTGLSFSPLLTS